MLSNRSFYDLSEPTKLRWPSLPDWLYLLIIATLAGVSIIVASIIGSLFLIPIFGLDAFTEASSGNTSAEFLTSLLIANFLPIFFIVWIWLRIFEKRGLASVGMQLKGAVRNYLKGIVVGLAMLGGAVGLMSVLGYTAVEAPFSGASVAGAFLVLVGWIVQGAGEEVLTRGFLLQIFGRISGSVVGILVSAIIFTAFHALNANVGLIPFLNLFLFGVFAALYTLYEGGLWGIFAIHSMWNWAQGNLFGFEVSGNVIEDAIVLDLMETGPDTLTGGAFGPEGGLLVTVVLVIAMACVWWADSRKSRGQ